jgi:hypothetical protein
MKLKQVPLFLDTFFNVLGETETISITCFYTNAQLVYVRPGVQLIWLSVQTWGMKWLSQYMIVGTVHKSGVIQ